MKLKLFYVLVIYSLFGANSYSGAFETKQKHGLEKCQCYCSVKCGPRDIKIGTDKPRTKEVIINGKRSKVCFCADRDELLFYKNKCHLKPKSQLNLNCCELRKLLDL